MKCGELICYIARAFDLKNSRSARLNIMHTIIFASLALAIISTALAIPSFAVAKAQADEDIFYLLVPKIATGNSADPKIITQCFNHYMPLLSNISVNFSLHYEQCVTVASQAAVKLSATAAQNRTTFVNESATFCSAFTSCNSNNNMLDFLNCYAIATSVYISEIYHLSASASNAAISLRGGLQQINVTENICKNKAQQKYATQTAEAYQELYACLANSLPADTTESSSSKSVFQER